VAVISAAGAIVVALVGLFAGNRGVGDPVFGEQVHSTTTVRATETATTTETAEAAESPTSAVAFASSAGSAGSAGARLDSEVTLAPGSGADLDRSKAAVAKVPGPDGAIDLYWDGQTIRPNGGDLYSYYETEPSLDGCSSAFSKNPNLSGKVVLFVGDKLCFKTSGKKAAWLRVNDLNGPQGRSTLVLNVVVW